MSEGSASAVWRRLINVGRGANTSSKRPGKEEYRYLVGILGSEPSLNRNFKSVLCLGWPSGVETVPPSVIRFFPWEPGNPDKRYAVKAFTSTSHSGDEYDMHSTAGFILLYDATMADSWNTLLNIHRGLTNAKFTQLVRGRRCPPSSIIIVGWHGDKTRKREVPLEVVGDFARFMNHGHYEISQWSRDEVAAIAYDLARQCEENKAYRETFKWP